MYKDVEDEGALNLPTYVLSPFRFYYVKAAPA
jgi:hypothetical protein